MDTGRNEEKRIIVFVHIPKAAGSSITHFLRSTYGLNHCRAYSSSEVYSKKDFEYDKKLYSGLKAISGHQLRPYIDFGTNENNLFWFTMLREPLDRFYSQYKWWCKQNKLQISFEAWCDLKGEKYSDFQVRWLAGEPNIEVAKRIVEDKINLVGDQSDFDLSLKMLKYYFPKSNLPTIMTKKVNIGNTNSRLQYNKKLAAKYNKLDLELYTFFRESIWQQQLNNLDSSQQPFSDHLPNYLRRVINLAYHRGVYVPIKKMRGIIE